MMIHSSHLYCLCVRFNRQTIYHQVRLEVIEFLTILLDSPNNNTSITLLTIIPTLWQRIIGSAMLLPSLNQSLSESSLMHSVVCVFWSIAGGSHQMGKKYPCESSLHCTLWQESEVQKEKGQIKVWANIKQFTYICLCCYTNVNWQGS
jgi:hypothetical protein